MPYEITFDKIPAGYSLDSVRPGEVAKISVREFLCSDNGALLIKYLNGFPQEILDKLPGEKIHPSTINHLLAVIRKNKTATIYINELNQLAYVQVKRDVEAGEEIYHGDISNIQRMRFEGVDIPDDCGVFIIFSVGWEKAIYFDLIPIQPENPQVRDYELEVQLGQLHAYLNFRQLFEITETMWELMFKQKWFPFISLPRNLLEDIINYSKNGWDIDDIITRIEKYLIENIESIKKRWKGNHLFNEHYELFDRALDRYTEKDHISCVSILFPRIEGLMRTVHSEKGTKRKASEKIMIDSVIGSNNLIFSYLLPTKFSQYLNDIYFKEFRPGESPDISRHSVSHGVADKSDFSLKSATIGLLIVDQLRFYLNDTQN